MIQLDSLSKIGFGAYRVSAKNIEHHKSLLHALQSGCNLIDTAANYSYGESEELIGKVTINNDKVFISTKAGYIQGQDIFEVGRKNFKNLVKINENFWYSLDEDFLGFQIKNSLKRLNRKYIDGFFLHNPEHYFSSEEFALNKNKVYKIIEKAFAYLEEQVSKGSVRYYGISSNTFPFSSQRKDTFDVNALIDLAAALSTNHSFKIIQFPFNAIENDATKVTHSGTQSLVELIKQRGLVSFSNRPLNAIISQEAVRLATYDETIDSIDEESDDKIFEELFSNILNKLKDHGSDNHWEEFPVLVHLRSGWKKHSNPEAVQNIFRGYLNPFLDSLFESEIPESVRSQVSRFYDKCVLYSRREMSTRAKAIENELVDKGIIEKGGEKLTRKLCANYLAEGIDHVLVGMRNEQYVSDFVFGFCS